MISIDWLALIIMNLHLMIFSHTYNTVLEITDTFTAMLPDINFLGT